MARGARWIDLLDPDREEVLAHTPVELHPRALDRLVLPPQAEHEPRPALENHGDYVFGVLLVAVAVPDEDRVFYQEIDLVLTPEVALTVRKTPPGEAPFDLAEVQKACDAHGSPSTGLVAYYLVDEIAERYLQLIDVLDDEIDELEDGIDEWPTERVRKRLSELRHDVLQIRRTLSPTRDAVRRVVDGRVDVGDDLVFTRSLELDFADAYDKLLRATEALDISRELITERARVPPVQDRPGAERDRQEAHRDGLAGPRPDLHRRRLRPELRPLPRAPLALRLRALVGGDRADDPRPARLLPLEEVDLIVAPLG